MHSYQLRIAPLAIGTFALGTDLLVVAGILPEIAKSFAVSVGTSGQLISVFAVAFVVASLLGSIFGDRISAKPLLVGTMGVFAVANLLCGLAPSFALLLAARVLAAVAAALATPRASAVGAQLAPPESRGQALAIVWGGFSVATVVGVPLGTAIAGMVDWRTTFYVVAAFSALATLSIALLLPSVPKDAPSTLAAWFGVVRRPRVLAVCAITMLMMAGQFVVFTYIAPVVGLLTGRGNTAVATALFVFGAAAIGGNVAGGVLTDRIGAGRTLTIGLSVFVVSLIAISCLAWLPVSTTSIAGATIALVVWGLSAWAFIPPQQQRLLAVAPDGPTTALGLNGIANYIGIALGGAIGGWALSQGWTAELGFIGSVPVLVALGASLLLAPAFRGLSTPSAQSAPSAAH